MIKNVLPSLRQGGGPQRICSRQKKHPQRHCPGRLLANPAHAGKRRHTSARYECPRDHPRTCGEKQWQQFLWIFQAGSPPRMRGKDWAACCAAGISGITPAHAGKRPRNRRSRQRRRDHPRTCGEKQVKVVEHCNKRGSPPHMRGKAAGQLQKNQRAGITPAHAGKSAHSDGHGWRSWDHPRTCGEKLSTPSSAKTTPGSPPHMRGKVERFWNNPDKYRITPAHAGKRYVVREARVTG